ncbi:MAG: rRNA pseudouridine synthase [Candidatus Helarchaeota archaeon]|nr:rRNA pseudouridine synthase [Candidatus Helarchaeota archaeon]
MMRLNKFLAKAGVLARRKCDHYIFSGMVFVNGKKIDDPSYKIDEKKDEVFLNNKRIVLKEKYRYIVLNKPKGCVTTLKDEKGRKKVIDYVNVKERLFPIGRLDVNTTGVLLLTNDGEIAYRLSHPKYQIDKIYNVILDKQISGKDIQKLRKGVIIGKDEVVSAEAKIIENKYKKNMVRIKIHTGKKRQIKRMFNTIRYNVLELDRTEFAGIKKDELKLGSWRNLTKDEVETLRKLVI